MTASDHDHRTALVIGCGIGGPVAAMALQKAGIGATIFEAHAGHTDYVGSFLNAASNGLDALAAIGAHDAVLAHGFPTPRMVMWSGSGKRLGEVANGTTRPGATPSLTIERGRLHAALRDEAIARGIDIVSGKRLVGAEPSAHGVTARFADGSEARGDLLVGSDGLHSTTRRLVDPAAPWPRFTGLLSLGGRACLDSVTPTPGVFHMIFGRRAFFGYSAPVPGDVYWFANAEWTGAPDRARLDAISPAMWKTHLRDLFAGDAGPALDIVGATGDTLAAYPIFDMPIVPVWHRDRMIVIGDAAHATSPSSGQGASLAIEDAVILAQCLRDADDVSTAFAAYERLRRARVERVVSYSARIGRSKTPGPVGRWLRDLMMPFALRHFASAKAQAWLYEHRIEWGARPALV
jgi:2-polyprenyl-6-methoxyphenol hydroxylase-like FAD-dependent oxidoreductase